MRRSTALLTLALVIAVGLLAWRVWFAPRARARRCPRS